MLDNFPFSEILPRSAVFIKEAQKNRIRFKAFWGPSGSNGNFQMLINDKIFRFDKLPIADHLSKYNLDLADDKKSSKDHLRELVCL